MKRLSVFLLLAYLFISGNNALGQVCISLSSGPGTDAQTVCLNTLITPITYTLAPTVTGATVTGLPAGVNGIYSPGLFTISGTPSASGIFDYTVQTTGGTCTGSGRATGRITVNTIPVPSLVSSDGDNMFCYGTSITFTAGGGVSYSFRVNGGIVQTGASTTYTTSTLTSGQTVDVVVTAPNGCTAISATILNTVNPVPVASASNNGPVCPGTQLTLTGGPAGMIAYTWSGPGGYSSGQQSPVVSASATAAMAGVYSLTVTNSFGCQNLATTTVVVRDLPSVTASNNGPVCVGSLLTLTGGPAGMTDYSWTGPNGFTSKQISPMVSPSATTAMAGTYSLTVTNSFGCTNTVSTIVQVNTLPVVTAANNGPVCSGSPLTLTGGPVGMTTYSWTGPNGFVSSLQSPVVSLASTTAMAGVYNLTVINSSGCQSSIATTVIVNQSPVATATNNGPVCAGAQLSLTGGPSGMVSYSWVGPNSFVSSLQSPVVSPVSTIAMAGVYTLTVTSAGGCRDTATTRAGVYAIPVSNAGPGGVECDLNFILSALPSVGTGLWSVVTGPGTATFAPGATSPAATVTVSAYGSYTFRWTETNGPCISSSVTTVNFYQPPVSVAGTGGDECDMDFVFNAVSSSGLGTWIMTEGTGTVSFLPNANTPDATVTVSEYGTKEFTWIELNGTCSDSSSIIVNFNQAPVANAGTGGNNCGFEFNLGASPSIGTGTWTRISGPGAAIFTPNANTPNAKVRVSVYGTYVFSWTETNGTCSSSTTISVTFIQQPAAYAGNGGDECDLNFILNAVLGPGTGSWSKVSGPGNVTFTPNANQPNATVSVTQFGIYDLAWTEVNSLCTSTDIIRVTFHDLPSINAGKDTLICKGRNVQLNATGTGSFLWTPANLLNNPAISNPVATPAVTTVFNVTLTDQWGCKNSDQVSVEVRPQPVANAGQEQILAYQFETYLDAVAPGINQLGEWTLLEGDGDISNVNDPSSEVSGLVLGNNSFIWTVSNGVCPISADTVKIIVLDLKIPTLITPNHDGSNDYFVIEGIETFGKTSLTVFNRWGARVFENPVYDNNWDGTDENNNPLPDDTYFYILRTEKGRVIREYLVIRR